MSRARLPESEPGLRGKSNKNVHGRGTGRRPGASNCWMVPPDERGRRGAAPAGGTAEASPVRASSCTPVVLQRKAQHRVSPNPANPLVKPEPPGQGPFLPPNPGKNAKNAAPRAPLRGPGPRRLHLKSGRARSVPGGPRSEDDPCLGLRRRRTGGACGSFIIRHLCDTVNTFAGDSRGFFCHSVIQCRSGEQAAPF